MLSISKKNRSGFTLIEMVLSIAIMAIVAGVVGPIMITGVRSYGLVEKRKSALAQVRLVMDRLSQEVRLIATTNDIDTFTSSTFQFDIPSEANINYTLSGANLTRSGVVMADGVTSISFTYYDSNGNVTATKANIWRIGVEMVLNAGTGYGSIKVRQQIFPRQFFSDYAGYQ